ncbi:MAG: glycosyltransferase [Bacteroidetes bacterium]|nr:glycosyltransferase [Bacteroidota bacterium]
MKKKILIILYNISKAQEHEWFVEMINRDLFDIEFALINGENSYMDKFLQEHKVVVYNFSYSKKTNLPGLTWNLFKLMKRNKYDIVHTHLFEANIAGITAAFLAHVPKRILTRHHSDFHHVYYGSAVKYDKLANYLCTDIVAISKNVENILLNIEFVNPKKVHLIHHGIDMHDYLPGAVSLNRVETIKNAYQLTDNSGPVIGVISRFIELKGLQYLIPAFKEVLLTYPDAILFFANAKGDYEQMIYDLSADVDPKNYRLVPFENDIAALYKVFDCFVHIPITATVEAFGQIYLESLASMVPSVFTLSGVAPEFAIDKVNCFVVPFKDAVSVRDRILFILNHKNELDAIKSNGFNLVKEKFDIRFKISKLEQLYS